MAADAIVLVRSFPQVPLIRQVYAEMEDTVLVWRGGVSEEDIPAPCPKSHVFVYDAELWQKLENEKRRNGANSTALSSLWGEAQPYYDVDNHRRGEYNG